EHVLDDRGYGFAGERLEVDAGDRIERAQICELWATALGAIGSEEKDATELEISRSNGLEPRHRQGVSPLDVVEHQDEGIVARKLVHGGREVREHSSLRRFVAEPLHLGEALGARNGPQFGRVRSEHSEPRAQQSLGSSLSVALAVVGDGSQKRTKRMQGGATQATFDRGVVCAERHALALMHSYP